MSNFLKIMGGVKKIMTPMKSDKQSVDIITRIFRKIANWYFRKKALSYWMLLFFDCFVVFLSGLLSYVLFNGIENLSHSFLRLCLTLLIYLIPFIIGFQIMRTYRGVFRYSTFIDLYRVILGNLIGAVIIFLLRLLFNFDEYLIPITIEILFVTFILSSFIMSFARIFVKNVFDSVQEDKETIPVFIYGVKSGGIALAKAITEVAVKRYSLKGFLSDTEDMPGRMLMGVKVYRNDADTISQLKKMGIKALLISPLKKEMLANNLAMVDRLISEGITIYTTDITSEWDSKNDIQTSQLREIQIEDLLHREEINIDMDSIRQLLRGKRVFITGSAGSIGSEMVRQIASFDPEQLILIDEAETPQHDVRLMLSHDFPNVKAEAIVTSITKHRRMESLFKMYRPDYVFHAAAYKHVPMMEDNPSEAVHNNIDGTRVIADLSVKYGVKKFVMVSTDKAVNPTNVMGCSKRICEIYVQSLDKAIKDGKVQGITQFVTTRFGNVLGSNGSVIPLFRNQIKNGGPVTVTHPDIVRYFMLIPEACKLVLEAGTMGKGGEIFVFDMGKPVKIVDLAKRMIQLSGAKDIEIVYTGLRDGEKLYEEVLNDEEKTKPTFHKKIKIAQVKEYDYFEVSKDLDTLLDTSYLYDDMNTVAYMKKIVPEYRSQHSKYEILDK